MSPSLQAQLEQWMKDMRPTPARDNREQGDRHARDRTFIEKLRDKIAEDARAGGR